ncbi:MAG: acetoacetate decarboxylase family protein [Actinobacteria bacterium]|nr:acetoacetate decarboxylase family protein [Actinomycetota bacterium]
MRVPAGLRSLLPDGLRPLPGPAALAAVRYTDSPVGPYLELALGLPARLGLRPGLCVVLQVVSQLDARVGYRQNWGLPASMGKLSWSAEGDERVLRCEEPDIEVRGIPVGPGIPAVVPVRSVQRRADGPVLLPRRFVALTRLARVVVSVDDAAGAELAALAGPHPGAVMAGVRIVARPARHPAGFLSSLRAPLRVVEPALGMPAPPAGRPTTVWGRAGA